MHGHLRNALFIAATAGATATAPLTAWAVPPPDAPAKPSAPDLERARELFENGKGLYQEGSYAAAIAAFRQAYALSGDPVLLYNIALAHDRAGDFDGALEYLEYYRAFAPESERAALEEKEESLRKRRLRARTEDGSEDADGSEDGEVDAPPQSEQADESNDDSTASSQDETQSDSREIFTTPVWVLGAVSIVGLGVGTGLGITALRRSDDAEARCGRGENGTVCPAEARSDADSARRLGLGADIAFGVGAAAGVVAIVLIVRNAVKKKKAPKTALVPRARGAALQIRF